MIIDQSIIDRAGRVLIAKKSVLDGLKDGSRLL